MSKVTERIGFILRFILSSCLLAGCGIVALLLSLFTFFRRRHLVREFAIVPAARLLLRIWGISYAVHGEIPGGGRQVVYISNHTSTIDLFLILAMNFPNCRYFLSDYVRRYPFMGLVGDLLGIFWTVTQEYPEKRREIFADACRKLELTGESVYLSPEGERVVTGQIGKFNKGAFHLATALSAPIVPFFIAIPREMDPGLGYHARPGIVHVYFGEPINTAKWSIDGVVENKERVRERFIEWHSKYRMQKAA